MPGFLPVSWMPRADPTITLGTTRSWSPFPRPFRLTPQELNSHLHIIGVTGQGKSKLLAHYAAQLILQGRACSVMDPHADLVQDVLQLLLDARYFERPDARQRVLYVDFSNRTGFVPFNVLKQPYSVDQIASHLVEACTRAWSALADGQAPQFENILLSGATVLIYNHLPLTHLTRLLTDKPYREGLLMQCPDPQVVDFFHQRFDQWGKETPLMIESTLRRIFLLSYSPTLRYSLGQSENRLNFRALLDNQVSVLFNLGGLDEQTQRLIGCLLSVGFEVAALSRADLPPQMRTPYHLLLDEFSMFSAQSEESLSRVLSLARKYGLFLGMAHQTFSQLSSRLQGALQNTNQIVFRLGRDDAVWAAPRLASYDPTAIKHVVEDEAAEQRTHPVFYSIQETYEQWAKAIEGLKPREAFVRIGNTTHKLRTVEVKPPRSHPRLLEDLRTYYAHTLLTPGYRLDQQQGAPPADVLSPSPLNTPTPIATVSAMTAATALGRKLVRKTLLQVRQKLPKPKKNQKTVSTLRRFASHQN